MQLVGENFGQADYPLLMTNYAIKKAAYEQAAYDKVIYGNKQQLIEQVEEKIAEIKKEIEPETNRDLLQLESFLKKFSQQATETTIKSWVDVLSKLLKKLLPVFEKHIKPVLKEIVALLLDLHEPLPVNMPYNPQINALDICYTSTAEVIFNEKDASMPEPDATQLAAGEPGSQQSLLRCYQVSPAGYTNYSTQKAQLIETQSVGIYLGLGEVEANREARLYFQGIPGDSNRVQVPIKWQYLNNEGWADLTDYILYDGTYGLTQSGLLRWCIPSDMTSNNPLMPIGSHWLAVMPDTGFLQRQEKDKAFYWQAMMEIQVIKTNGLYIKRLASDLLDEHDITLLPDNSQLNLDNENYGLDSFYHVRGGETGGNTGSVLDPGF